MAGVPKLLSSSLILVCILQAGLGNAEEQCDLSDIHVTQTKTGATVQGKPEYSVAVASDCVCVFLEVMLECGGFNSAEPVDPLLLKPVDGSKCLVNDGRPISSPITFKYAWDTQFGLKPTSFQIACS